ncbi:anti-sigma factor [Tropicibacter alexandrii]|uniref:anti-sigma factor n=1 Tax=Tropicibacter alexandrii TaxID=2267683 RepID=UPI000EF4A928|nr:anti-sigma factor [Tropicibacter alexandrii]
MSDESTDLPGGPEAEAAEYALGLLTPEEARAFERAMAESPDLEQDVVAWSEYFATFTDPIPEQTPPPALLRRIEKAAFGEPAPSFWRQVLPYLGGAVAAVAVAWVVITTGLLEPEGDIIVAELTPAAGDMAFDVRIDPPTHRVDVTYRAGTLPADRVLELWLIPVGAAPISLGVMDAEGVISVTLSDEMAARVPGGTLAVSDEPVGGSPTGAPTGTVQAAGVPIPG